LYRFNGSLSRVTFVRLSKGNKLWGGRFSTKGIERPLASRREMWLLSLQMTTIKGVATLAGVPSANVSHVINKKTYVTQDFVSAP
jgi:hypothetical protein